MKADEQSNQAIPDCDLYEQKLNSTVRIYSHNTRLCSACFQHILNMPEIVAKMLSGSSSETLCESLKRWSAQIMIRGAGYAH